MTYVSRVYIGLPALPFVRLGQVNVHRVALVDAPQVDRSRLFPPREHQ